MNRVTRFVERWQEVSENRRCQAGNVPKHVGEMTLIGKSRQAGDSRESSARIQKLATGELNAEPLHIFAKRSARYVACHGQHQMLWVRVSGVVPTGSTPGNTSSVQE